MIRHTELMRLGASHHALPESTATQKSYVSTPASGDDTARHVVRGRARLAQWTPLFADQPRGAALRSNRRPLDTSVVEQWAIRASGIQADDLWITGNFMNWRLPGLQMSRSVSGEWEGILSLAPGDYQFACYQFFPGKGVQRVVLDKVDFELLSRVINPLMDKSA